MSAPARPRTWSTNTHPEPLERKHPANTASSTRSSSPSPPSYNATTATLQRSRTTSTTTETTHVTTLSATNDAVAAPSFLQPRVAAVLGVSRGWQPVLFSLRLLSILPSIILGFPVTIRFLLMLHAFATTNWGSGEALTGPVGRASVGEERLLLTELILAIIWCGCSGYLSFFFTDYLMSRWLINYTPSATAFRLISVSALNGYLQSWTLHLSGSSQDPFLLLPTWIIITSTLTLVYHIIHRKINIRKETSTSISVFSMASYLSMVAMLIQQHWDRTDWLELPFVALGCRVLKGGGDIVVWVAKYTNITIAP